MILASIFLGERVSLLQVSRITIGLTGALLVVLSGGESRGLLDHSYLWGNVILAVHGFLWALYTVGAKPLLARYSPLEVTHGALLLALVALIPLVPLEMRGRPLFHGPPGMTLLWVVLLGVLVSFLATVFWNAALRRLSPVVIAGFVFVQPVVGAVMGRLVFGERLATGALVGGVLIGSAVFLVAKGEGCRAPRP
ncbi:MAG: DMT family transporter [Planctomycetota bacterium]